MFQRRLIVFSALLIVAMGVLVARLAWLQIHDGAHYVKLADELLEQQPHWLDTVRGSIYDCHGQALAEDQLGFKICLHYKLTRLYDKEYWKYRQLQYLQKNPGKTPTDATEYTQKKFGPELVLAEQLLTELAEIIDEPIKTIYGAIDGINDKIFIRRVSQARYKWYKDNDIIDQYEPKANAQAIQADFAERVPDDNERNCLIYQTNLLEMNQAHPILESITKETALTARERFVGTFLADSDYDRPVTVRTIKTRVYPYHDAACHLIGQLGPVLEATSQPQIKRKPAPEELTAYYADDRRGQWGIEQMFETYLRGQSGWIKRDIEHNTIDSIDPISGADVKMTIDIELQKDIYEIFQGQNDQQEYYRGAAVIIDVPTGQIRAAVSVPTFDLNTYYQADLFNKINFAPDDDQEKLSCNRAFMENYQPGSTIKPTILLGALEKNIINAQTEYYCDIQGKTWDEPSHIYGHGQTTPEKAIRVSCNFYLIKVGEKMGSSQMLDWLKQAGFGKQIMAWPGELQTDGTYTAFRETVGYLSPIGQALPTPYHLRFMSIGLNPLEASVLQIANSTATIARDGQFVKPSLTITPATGQYAERIASINNARIMQQGMRGVIYELSGTAYNAFHPLPWDESKVQLYGKTGSTGKSLFACYARADDGRCLALAVVVEVDADGSKVAAPMAREILRVCSRHGYLPPDKPIETESPSLSSGI
jgi:cell division protein FtsI/penicillin-binding protein 2